MPLDVQRPRTHHWARPSNKRKAGQSRPQFRENIRQDAHYHGHAQSRRASGTSGALADRTRVMEKVYSELASKQPAAKEGIGAILSS